MAVWVVDEGGLGVALRGGVRVNALSAGPMTCPWSSTGC